MLVLSRRLGEKVLIGDGEISVTVLDVERGKVKLGFVGPDDVAFVRSEISGGLKPFLEAVKKRKKADKEGA